MIRDAGWLEASYGSGKIPEAQGGRDLLLQKRTRLHSSSLRTPNISFQLYVLVCLHRYVVPKYLLTQANQEILVSDHLEPSPG